MHFAKHSRKGTEAVVADSQTPQDAVTRFERLDLLTRPVGELDHQPRKREVAAFEYSERRH